MFMRTFSCVGAREWGLLVYCASNINNIAASAMATLGGTSTRCDFAHTGHEKNRPAQQSYNDTKPGSKLTLKNTRASSTSHVLCVCLMSILAFSCEITIILSQASKKSQDRNWHLRVTAQKFCHQSRYRNLPLFKISGQPPAPLPTGPVPVLTAMRPVSG